MNQPLRYDFNPFRPLPRTVEVDVRVLPPEWAEFCIVHKIRIFVVIGYENEVQNIKIWPASGIIARGIERGEHLKTNTLVESTSGNFAIGLEWVVRQMCEQDPNFPIQHIVAVVPKSLQPGKIARLEAGGRIQLAYANDSVHAMQMAEGLARDRGWWYTEQYWNEDNAGSYTRIGAGIANDLPDLAVMARGVGSSGGIEGIMKRLAHAFDQRECPKRLHRVAVVVEPGGSVGGVRTELALQPGSNRWRSCIDDIRYVGLADSLKFSQALWSQGIIAGESSGFELCGLLLGLAALVDMEKLGPSLRNQNKEVIAAFVAADTREPYREEYEDHGIFFPH